MEGQKTLVDWGVKVVKGNKNVQSLVKVEKLMEFYWPDVLMLQDVATKGSRRGPRIKSLNRQIIKMTRKRKLKVALFSGKQLRRFLLGNANGTKQEMAEMIAGRFPEELPSRLPPKRRPWTSEDSRMDIFDAAALVVAFHMRKKWMVRTG